VCPEEKSGLAGVLPFEEKRTGNVYSLFLLFTVPYLFAEVSKFSDDQHRQLVNTEPVSFF
jgi:hypothetical protein